MTSRAGARSGVTVFPVAFGRWIRPAADGSLRNLITRTLDEFVRMTAGDSRPG